MKRSLLVLVFGATAMAASAEAKSCDPFTSDIMERLVRPVIEAAPACEGAPHLNKTKQVRLKRFEYCLENGVARVEGRIFVRCATSSKALFPSSAEEDIDFLIGADEKTCALKEFTAQPRGEVGRLIAKAARLEEAAKTAAKNALEAYCAAR